MRLWLMHLQQAAPNGTSMERIDKILITAVKGIIDLWSPNSKIGGSRAVMLSEFNKSYDFGDTCEDLSPLEVFSAFGLELFL